MQLSLNLHTLGHAIVLALLEELAHGGFVVRGHLVFRQAVRDGGEFGGVGDRRVFGEWLVSWRLRRRLFASPAARARSGSGRPSDRSSVPASAKATFQYLHIAVLNLVFRMLLAVTRP